MWAGELAHNWQKLIFPPPSKLRSYGEAHWAVTAVAEEQAAAAAAAAPS